MKRFKDYMDRVSDRDIAHEFSEKKFDDGRDCIPASDSNLVALKKRFNRF